MPLKFSKELVHMCVCKHSVVSDSLCLTPWTVASQGPLSTKFSRQEYWSRFPFTTPGDLPNPEIAYPALVGGFFTSRATGEVPVDFIEIRIRDGDR